MSVTQSLSGHENSRSWDDTLKTGWPDGFRLVDIRSTADGVHLDAQTRFEVAAHIASVISPALQGVATVWAQTNCIDSGVIIPPAWAFGVLYGGYTDQGRRLSSLQRS